jgi:hypothetical protein
MNFFLFETYLLGSLDHLTGPLFWSSNPIFTETGDILFVLRKKSVERHQSITVITFVIPSFIPQNPVPLASTDYPCQFGLPDPMF